MLQMRMGVSLGLIPGFSLEDVDGLMTAGQPAGVMRKTGRIMEGTELDAARADVIRKAIEELEKSKEKNI